MRVLTATCESGGTNPDDSSVNKALDYVNFRDVNKMHQINSICSLRYLVKTGPLDKALKPDEVPLLHNAGIGIIAQFERSNTTSFKGYSQGVIDGTAALHAAYAIGYPEGLPIVASIDTAVTSATVGVVRDYLQGFKSALGNHYPMGIYGGTVIIRACLDISVLNWVAGAKSWSSNPPFPGVGLPIHFVQHISGSTPQYDMNDIVLPSQMWLPHDEPDPKPDTLPGDNYMTTTTLTVLGRPERPYDSRSLDDPSLANPLNPNENPYRAIYLGHDGINVAQIHVTIEQPANAGFLTFWDGTAPRPNVATVNFAPGQINQSLVTVPVVDGHVRVYSTSTCHVVFDLQAVGA